MFQATQNTPKGSELHQDQNVFDEHTSLLSPLVKKKVLSPKPLVPHTNKWT